MGLSCDGNDFAMFAFLGVACICIVVVPFNVLSIAASILCYKHRHSIESSANTLRAFKLFFAKWRAECWWWGFAYSLRQQLLALSLIFVSDDGASQVTWACSVFLVYTAAAMIFKPWLVMELNYVDGLGSCVLLMLLVVAGLTPPAEPTTEKTTYEAVSTILLVFLLALVGCFLARAGVLFLARRKTYAPLMCNSLSDEECLALLTKLEQCNLPPETLSTIVQNMTPYDRDAMLSFMRAFEHASVHSVNFFDAPPVRALVLGSGMLQNESVAALRSQVSTHKSSSKTESYI